VNAAPVEPIAQLDASHITVGNSFSEDGHAGRTFDYCLANPPFGVEWKKVQDVVKNEADKLGFRGRFGAGLPRINDGSFLFLQHMISKMKPVEDGGSRIAIVFNGSPLFTGAAGSGESEIRRWIIENDWLEAVVALPDQMFYNTGISTYFWIVTNRKSPERRGKVQLVDGREMFSKMRKSLGEKRKEISDTQIEEITRLYAEFTESDHVKIFPNEAFGYLRITVERPLRLRWEVTEETRAALAASKAYQKLCETGIGDLPAEEVPEAFKRILDRYTELAKPDPTVDAAMLDPLTMLETVLANATIDTWRDMGWEIDWDHTPWTWAEALELKPAQVTGLIDALAVRDPFAPVIFDKRGNPEPDSDLRDRLVTVDVAPLDEGETADALARGVAVAREFQQRGLIIAATLGLNDRVERVDPVTLIDRKPAHA
jgi:type I restriction enzyme M protein